MQLSRQLVRACFAVLVLALGSCADIIGADFGDYAIDVPDGSSGNRPGSGGGGPTGGGPTGGRGASGGGGFVATGGVAGAGGIPPNAGGTPPCVPRTCAAVGAACGSLSDGCTGTITCVCASGTVCVAGACCTPATSCNPGQCGTASDGCNGQLDCGPCSGGCVDAVRNGSETDVDCGGPICSSCPVGGACILSTDCLSGVCTGGFCVSPPTCTPTANPAEVCDAVDNDCDGTVDNPGACPSNCIGASYEGVAYVLCKTSQTWLAAEASCAAQGMHLTSIESSAENDWLRTLLSANGVSFSWIGASDRSGEGSWRWLGGTRFWIGAASGTPDSGRFENWLANEPNNDTPAEEDCGVLRPSGWNDDTCTDLHAYLCEQYAVPSGCFDGVLNGTETDVDCGGGCGACPSGSACSVNTDCDRQSCSGSVCVNPCTNGVKDGTETDVDCGGTCSSKCAAGKICSIAADCTSGQCTAGTCGGCVEASCPACTIVPLKCCTPAGTCGCRFAPSFPCQ